MKDELKDEPPILTTKQQAALLALVSCATLGDAAKQCGVSEVTLWRWQQEPAFQHAYAAARRKALEQAFATLQANCGEATRTLVSLLQDTNTPPAVRVSACRSVLEYALRGTELIDLNARLSALEAQLGGE